MVATAVRVHAAGGAARPIDELTTPFALIDGIRMRANILAMQEAVTSVGAALRPHFKTHRTSEIAAVQCSAGAVGLTVATARQLATVSVELGYPALVSSVVQADAAAAPTLREACAAGEVVFAIESRRSVELLRRALGRDVQAEVAIEVEAGCERSGVVAAECAAVAAAARRHGFHVVGVFSYPGQGYAPGRARDAAELERAVLHEAVAVLARAGFEAQHVSAGSTPTMPYARAGVVTEYRPGTYVFGDRQQMSLGAAAADDLALTVIASVTAVHGSRVVVDAGGKALGRDAPGWLDGYGVLADRPDAVIARLYDHHSVLERYRGERLEVGDRVAIVPNNANSVMALLESAWLTEDGKSAVELRPRADR